MTPSASRAGIDLDDARRKREDNIIQLRKDRRDENLQKKRMVSAVAGAEGGELESTRTGQVQQKVGGRFAQRCGGCWRCDATSGDGRTDRQPPAGWLVDWSLRVQLCANLPSVAVPSLPLCIAS